MKNLSKHPASAVNLTTSEYRSAQVPMSPITPVANATSPRDNSFKGFLKTHISRKQVSPALIQSIKNKIRVPE